MARQQETKGLRGRIGQERRGCEVLPNFLVIGNLRSGTTWLDNCLRQHPDVFLPRHVKGTHFFSHRFHKGVPWYERHFDARQDERAVGEVSALCLGSEVAARNIHQVIPHARLIACLRDPMTSVWSHYLRELRQGRSRGPFLETLRGHPEIIGYHLHHRNLSRYLELFPREQILIILYDDISERPREILAEVFRFLGIQDDIVPDLATSRVNEARFIRFPFLARPIMEIRWRLRDHRMYRVINLVKQLGLVDLVFGLGAPRGLEYRAEDRRAVRELFLEDVSELAKLVSRDLGHWLDEKGTTKVKSQGDRWSRSKRE